MVLNPPVVLAAAPAVRLCHLCGGVEGALIKPPAGRNKVPEAEGDCR